VKGKSNVSIINVSHPTGSYPIYLDKGVLIKTGQYLADLGYGGCCAVITNETVGPLHAEPLLISLREAGFEPTRIDIPDGEQFKTLDTVADLYDQLVAAKLDRRSPVIVLGGGVVGDVAGFAAASYLRGVPFVQIPTTLLAMVDASVGGKTGVDLPHGKNLVGAFKQPEMVVIDPDVLSTLPEVEFRAGLAEVVKHGIIDAPQLFAALEKRQYDLTWLLFEAISVKVRIVQEDPFEQGRRAVLNLGHTFGHAFEQLSHYEIRHGEGVAMGLACAAQLAARLGHCSGDVAERIISLLDQLNLPFDPPAYPSADVWATMATDKKRQGNTLRFILPRAIGDVDIFNDVAEADVRTILDDSG
jgi:3-dehydroquinate synthase